MVADRRERFWFAAVFGTRVARIDSVKGDTLAFTRVELPFVAVSASERDSWIRGVKARMARYATSDFDQSEVPTKRPGIVGAAR